MSNRKTVVVVMVVLALTLFAGFCFRYFNDRNKLLTRPQDIQDSIVESNLGGTDDNDVEVGNKTSDNGDLFNEHNGGSDKDTGVQAEENSESQIYHLIKGKWILYKTGFKYPKRYMIIDSGKYEENLGDDILSGKVPDLTEPMSNVTKGTYRLVVDKDDSWKGVLMLKDGVDVRFRYAEDERYEPILEVLPNVFLIRENWEKDYRNNPNYKYPNTKE